MQERDGLKGRKKSEEEEEDGEEADAVGEGGRGGKSLGGAEVWKKAGLGGRNASQQLGALPSLKGKLRSNFGLGLPR